MLPALELMRPRQWVKNGFVMAPLFFGAGMLHSRPLLMALAAFAAYCLVSSAIYIFNDWRDIEADRVHLKKNRRPLPSGRISVPAALALLTLLIMAAAAILFLTQMPRQAYLVIGIYIIINLAYSLGLKHVSLVELFLVASGFVLRLLTGGVALDIELSPWIVLATGSVALLLTAGKRRGDMAKENDVTNRRKSLNGYTIEYLNIMLSALTGSTLVIYLLFCVSDYATQRYGGAVIMTAVPVAFGLLRYLQLVIVKNDGDSPTDLVTRDIGMISSILVFVAMFVALIYVR